MALGCTKPYPLTAVRSVGVLYLLMGIGKIIRENLQVLLVLRGKVGKCRSHKMCFWVYGTMVSDAKDIPEKARSGFTL